jgi:hypothetical protein
MTLLSGCGAPFSRIEVAVLTVLQILKHLLCSRAISTTFTVWYVEKGGKAL